MGNPQTTRSAEETFRGYVFYDGACEMCRSAAERFRRRLERDGYQLVPYQTAWVCERTGLTLHELSAEMRLLTADGSILSGIDAHARLAGSIWWARPLSVAVRVPGLRSVLRSAYRWIASRRSHLHAGYAGWLLLGVLVALAGLFGSGLPGWGRMWVMSAALFLGFKGLSWSGFSGGDGRTFWSTAAYFLAWPGMDPRAFFKSVDGCQGQSKRDWMAACIATLVGAGLIWVGAAMITPFSVYAGGATGFVGMIMMLHFGGFHLLAMLWRSRGREVRPIMDRPWRSKSLSEFWSRRWNIAFHQMVNHHIFRPLARRWGVKSATVATFVVSGAIHDLVISVPAGGGYGGPTAYFALQGLAVLFERSRAGSALGIRGRVFAVAVVLVPIGLLFHAPFVEHVFVPFLQVIGAIGG